MSSTLFNVLAGVVAFGVALALIAALIFVIVKRRPFAAAGVGLLLLQHVLLLASSFVTPSIVSSGGMEGFFAVNLGVQVVGQALFLIGLGLILAQIFVKRPAGGPQGHP